LKEPYFIIIISAMLATNVTNHQRAAEETRFTDFRHLRPKRKENRIHNFVTSRFLIETPEAKDIPS